MEQKTHQNQKPILYIIATPIGNLEEVSNRTKSVLNATDIIACEDTRQTSKLLAYLGIKKRLISCHEHNEKESSQAIISLIKEGKNVSYVSDAGYPLISDPGKILIDECLKNNINVSVVSGPSAFIDALCVSNLPTNHFYFHGFLDAKISKAKKELEELKDKKETLIFYVSVHKLREQINLFYEVFGNRKICLARELTKMYEHIIRIDLEDLIKYPLETLKGEFVFICEGNTEQIKYTDEFVLKNLKELISKNKSKKDAVKEVSTKYNLKKNYVYNLLNKIS